MATAHDLSHEEHAAPLPTSSVFARRLRSGRRAAWTRVASSPGSLFGATAVEEVTHLALIGETGGAPLVSYSVSRLGEEHCACPHPRDGTLACLAYDILRRCLGIPTAPNADPPSQWTLRAWLELVLDAAADPARPPITWPRAVALHPADRGHSPTPQELALDAIAVDEALPWPDLHRGVAAGRLVVPGLNAAEAAWMDHPFFARWLLAGHRDVEELLDDLHLFLSPEVASAIELTASVIGRLGFERHRSGVS